MIASSHHDEFGIKCRKWIPLAWRPRREAAITPEYKSALNESNAARLQTLVDRETRERPSAEIGGIESLLIEVLHCVKQLPPSRSVVLDGRGLEWIEPPGKSEASTGDQGVIRMALNAEIPYEVEFLAEITAITDDARGNRIAARFIEQSDRVRDLYEQLVFMAYRRSQRTAASPEEPE
ncbi:hypothetical protein ACS8Y6_05835 [Salinisphaera sp. RV14]|uniref:hypothetical protein n=1 Tax=unclassified Salinisphaera TaxID=2649847 RepID=UPI003F86B8EC